MLKDNPTIDEVITALGDAAFNMDLRTFRSVLDWPDDDYAEEKFDHFQAIGRALNNLHNGAVVKLIEAALQIEAARKAKP